MRTVFLLLLLCILPATPKLLASDLYTGEIQVSNQDESERRTAMAAALRQVLVKVSGDAGAADRPGIQAALANPEPLIQSFYYRQDVDRSGPMPALRLHYSASFDPRAIDRLLASGGLSQWARERPTLMVWVAIDAGVSTQLLSAGQLGPLLRRGTERGLVLRAGDSGGEGSTRVADVEARGLANLRQVAAGFGAPGVLAGRLYQTADGVLGRFAYSDGEREESFELRASDQLAALRAAADETADRMAARYAFAAGDSNPTAVAVVVRGLRNAEDFARVHAYLGSLSMVRRIRLDRAGGDTLAAELEVAGGAERLRQITALGDALSPSATDGDGALVFDLR